MVKGLFRTKITRPLGIVKEHPSDSHILWHKFDFTWWNLKRSS